MARVEHTVVTCDICGDEAVKRMPQFTPKGAGTHAQELMGHVRPRFFQKKVTIWSPFSGLTRHGGRNIDLCEKHTQRIEEALKP